MDAEQTEDAFAGERRRMLQWNLKGRDITDVNVLAAMAKIRREHFVRPEDKSRAYSDAPLPIGLGQTISQPYIVALMTQELRVNPDCEVLEIGTGSGYQTAILSGLAKKVYTVEKLEPLAESARSVLNKLDIANVEYYVGDGSCGWPEQKLFDRIIVTAAVPNIPEPLVEQLADMGLIVAPVGPQMLQELLVCEKSGSKLTEKVICGCRFVRLIGKYGFAAD